MNAAAQVRQKVLNPKPVRIVTAEVRLIFNKELLSALSIHQKPVNVAAVKAVTHLTHANVVKVQAESEKHIKRMFLFLQVLTTVKCLQYVAKVTTAQTQVPQVI